MDYNALQQLFRQICELLASDENIQKLGFRGAFGGDSDDGVEFYFLFRDTVMSLKFDSDGIELNGDLIDMDTVLDMHTTLESHQGGISDLFLNHS